MENLFENIPDSLPAELFEEIASGKSFRLKRIVSDGHKSNEGHWYDQVESEWVTLLRGSARIEFEESGDVIDLKPGDYLTIPAHARHRVLWTSATEKTVWLAIYFEN